MFQVKWRRTILIVILAGDAEVDVDMSTSVEDATAAEESLFSVEDATAAAEQSLFTVEDATAAEEPSLAFVEDATAAEDTIGAEEDRCRR